MNYFNSIIYVAATAIQHAMHTENTVGIMDVEDAIAPINYTTTYTENTKYSKGIEKSTASLLRPDTCGICSICKTKTLCSIRRMKLFGAENATGDIWSIRSAYYDSGRCLHCNYNTIHLGCALGSLYRIKCYNCGKDVCRRFHELDRLIDELWSSDVKSKDVEAFIYALNELESMQQSLIILTLCSYDMTADELKLVQKFAKDVGKMNNKGTQYPNIISTIRNIVWIKTTIRVQADEFFIFLRNTWAFAIALPVLNTIITPHLIANASEKQIMEIIEVLAGYRGVHAVLSNTLLKRIIDFADTEKTAPFTNNSILCLLYNLIDSNSCAVIKYLVGRSRFSHWLTNDESYAIMLRYAFKDSYEENAFMPLFIFLVNGCISCVFPQIRMLFLIDKFLWHDSNAINPRVYTKLQTIREKYNLGPIDIKDAVADYLFNDKDFNLSEDLFCAINGTQKAISEILGVIINNRGAGCVHILRHVPSIWIYNGIEFGILEEAIAQENPAVFEEILMNHSNTHYLVENMHGLSKILLNSSCRDCIGLLLRRIVHHKPHLLKNREVADKLLESLVNNKMYWCIPYLQLLSEDKNSHILISQYCQQIIDSAIFGRFRFSALFHEIIRCDLKNECFVENFPEYIGTLLKANTDRYAIQRFLIEILSLHACRRIIEKSKIAAMYGIFKTHQYCFFYLDIFYYALQYTSWKNSLKTLILDDFEELMTEKIRSVTIDMCDRVLQKRKRYRRCNSLECQDCKCSYCRLITNTSFESILAMLRYVKMNQ